MNIQFYCENPSELRLASVFLNEMADLRDRNPHSYGPVNAATDLAVGAGECAADIQSFEGAEQLEYDWANRRATSGTIDEARKLGAEFKERGLTMDDAPDGIRRNAKLLSAFNEGNLGKKKSAKGSPEKEPEASETEEPEQEDGGSDDLDNEVEETTDADLDDDLDDEPETAQNYTREEVKAVCMKFRDEENASAMRHILKEIAGTEKFSEVKEEHFAAIVRAMSL